MSARDELPFPRPWPEPSADPDGAPDERAPRPVELDDDVPLEDGAPTEEAPVDDWAIELDEDQWEALIPEDDYEPMPEYGDFWGDRDVA